MAAAQSSNQNDTEIELEPLAWKRKLWPQLSVNDNTREVCYLAVNWTTCWTLLSLSCMPVEWVDFIMGNYLYIN